MPAIKADSLEHAKQKLRVKFGAKNIVMSGVKAFKGHPGWYRAEFTKDGSPYVWKDGGLYKKIKSRKKK